MKEVLTTASGIIGEISEMKKRLDEVLSNSKSEVIGEITSALREIVKDYDKFESLSWRQYTMYFNDGDPCTFSVYADADDITVNDFDGYDDNSWLYEPLQNSEEPESGGYKASHGEVGQRNKIRHLASQLISSIPEQIMESAFDDHAQVTFTIDGGIESDDIEHD
jgi:hypothetical protein